MFQCQSENKRGDLKVFDESTGDDEGTTTQKPHSHCSDEKTTELVRSMP